MGLYYNGHKVRNLYFNGKCITRLALGKEMTRLVEGDDFVRAQWLRATSDGYARMMILPLGTASFSLRRKNLIAYNCPYFVTEGEDAYLNTSNSHTIQIWNSTNGLFYNSGTSFNRNEAISIVSTSDSLIVNSQNIPIYNYPVEYICFWNNDTFGRGYDIFTSSITVDGIERYIPVKLLKSIPSKYDANGIARQAGECGMYDTVNDVFYSNVASSGTFTVSDN